MAIDDTRSVKLFYSYSHNDIKFREELAKHLGRSHISGWHDREIVAGVDWAREIDTYLNSADIIILLISADFLASSYCYGIEMIRAMERYYAGEAIVVPVILRAVRWQNEPFGNLQALPVGGKPVASWVDKDEAFLDVANGIHKAIEKIFKKREETKKRYIDEARRYVVEGKPDAAYTSYRDALQLSPDDGALYKSMGDFLLAQKLYNEAVHAYDQAIHLNYINLSIYVNKGKALEHLERFEDAVSAYKSAIRLGGGNFSLYEDLGNALFRSGHYREAIKAFDRVMKLSSRRDAELYMRRGDALSMLESYQEALDDYEKGLKLAPGNALLYDKKGSMLSELQKYPEAIDAYRKATELDNRNAEYWRDLAIALDANGQFLEACRAYEEASRRSPHNAFFYKEKGDILVKQGDLPGALTAYTDAIRLNSTFRFAYLARCEVHQKMAAETYELYKRRLQLAQDDQNTAQQLGLREENA